MACKILQLNPTPLIKHYKLKKVFVETFYKTQKNLEKINDLSKEEFYFLLDMQKRTLGIKYGHFRTSTSSFKKATITPEKIANFEEKYTLKRAFEIIEKLEKLDYIRGYFISSITSKDRFPANGFILNPTFFSHANLLTVRKEKGQIEFNERKENCIKDYFNLSKIRYSERVPYEDQFEEDDRMYREKEEENRRRYPAEYINVRNTLPESVRKWHRKVLPEMLAIINYMKENKIGFQTSESRDFFIFLSINMFYGSDCCDDETREIFRGILSFFERKNILEQKYTVWKCYSYSKSKLKEHFSKMYKKYPELIEKTPNMLPKEK
jgi:hypothetical protein